MRRLTFAWRLALMSLLVTLLVMLLLAASLLLLVGRFEADRREAELRSVAVVEAAALSQLSSLSGVRSAATAEVQRFVDVPVDDDLVVRVFGLGNELLASSSSAIGYFPSAEAAELLGTTLPIRASDRLRRFVAEPIIVDDRVVAVLELSQSRAEELRLLGLIRSVLSRATLVAAAVALAGSVAVGRLLGRRVERLRQIAEGIAAGDLSRRAPEGGADELAELAGSLNRMAGQLEARLQELRDSAERERHFYRDVAHELRTPLMALHGYLEDIEDTATPEQHRAVAALRGEVERLSRLAGSLSRPNQESAAQTGREAVDLMALAEELVHVLAGRAARSGVTLDIQSDGSPALVFGSRDQLKQALLNLLDNALRHTPPGGTVTVKVAMVRDQEYDPGVELRVLDTGPGVPESLRDALWERGVRGPGGGSGLGLAIVKEIAAAHGGQARLLPSSSGAVFSLLLPAFTTVHMPVTGAK